MTSMGRSRERNFLGLCIRFQCNVCGGLSKCSSFVMVEIVGYNSIIVLATPTNKFISFTLYKEHYGIKFSFNLHAEL